MGFLFFIVAFAAITAVTMLLWNALLPALFAGVSVITYWQAAGLLVLARILLGGFKLHHPGWLMKHHHHHNEFFSSLKDMSPEEKRNFIRKHMETHHGFCHPWKQPAKETSETVETENQ
ncbi:MAG: hypothetical protein LIO97_13780 [Tannerellaceae bacterium]|nr:hypothetical protein [Tannerellaceae bacterium]